MLVARIRQDARESYEVVANENDIYGKTNIFLLFLLFVMKHKQNFCRQNYRRL